MITTDKIITTLKNNGLIAIPTDTIYGLIGNPFSEISVNKCYELKNRDRKKSLSIFLPSKNLIKDICITNKKILNFINYKLNNNTIILRKKNKNYLNLISNETIGIRIPNNYYIKQILKLYKLPLFATSINISNQKELLTYQDVYNSFNDKIDLIINNNTISSNKSSNIYQYINNKFIKIR